MRTKNPIPSVEKLRELFAYDPKSGVLTWRVSRGRVRPGVIAGEQTKLGYRVLRVDGVRFSCHRAIYKMAHGVDPGSYDVDHINGNPSDNRIENLRLVSHGQNMRNGKLRKNNTTGRRGVVWRAELGKYQAQITFRGRNNYLGLFDSADEASDAYERAAKVLHGQYARRISEVKKSV